MQTKPTGKPDDDALKQGAADILATIRAEPVPDAISRLAERLQAEIDVRNGGGSKR
jgi:hypothetical protein